MWSLGHYSRSFVVRLLSLHSVYRGTSYSGVLPGVLGFGGLCQGSFGSSLSLESLCRLRFKGMILSGNVAMLSAQACFRVFNLEFLSFTLPACPSSLSMDILGRRVEGSSFEPILRISFKRISFKQRIFLRNLLSSQGSQK